MNSALTFDSLGLRPELLVGLSKLGFEHPTPIQAEAIQPILSGQDVVLQAETGTGKTLAYGLPLLNGIAGTPLRPRLLVLVPTRELAFQVEDVLRQVARRWRPSIHAFVGGESIEPQLKLLEKGVAVMIGTPGRVHDLMRREAIVLKHCDRLVLDEVDEMLLRGFKADLDAILSRLPVARQTVLVSATVGQEVRAYAERTLKAPVEIGLVERSESAATLQHQFVLAPRDGKGGILERLLLEEPGQAIVFVRLKEETKRLAMRLRRNGFAAAYLSGDLPQANRNETMARFRDGTFRVLVATDVAARGLDLPDVNLVVNYAVPMDLDQYIHRAGRTGRAGRQGRVVTLVYREEGDAFKKLRGLQAMESLKATPLKRVEPARPWYPPSEPEEPIRAHPESTPAPRRVPRVSQHLAWNEDRPEFDRPERGPKPRTPKR